MKRNYRLALGLLALSALILLVQAEGPAADTESAPKEADDVPPPPPPPPAAPKSAKPKSEKKMKKAKSATPTLALLKSNPAKFASATIKALSSNPKGFINEVLHTKEAHMIKSGLVMGDVFLVMAGIQLQLSLVHEELLAAKVSGLSYAGKHSAMAHSHHHREQLCATGSTIILAVLLLENFGAMYAQGPKKFFGKKPQATDFSIVSTSLILELVFDRLTGFTRVFAELWRFVRIVHGAYETFFHSPLVAPHVTPGH